MSTFLYTDPLKYLTERIPTGLLDNKKEPETTSAIWHDLTTEVVSASLSSHYQISTAQKCGSCNAIADALLRMYEET